MDKQTAYCVKCRGKTTMVDVEQVSMKNGRPAAKGKCGVCGTNTYKILPNPKTSPNA